MATIVAQAAPSTGTSWSPFALWHLLSLDAPTVAALWTVFFAEMFGVSFTNYVPVALALAVWMLYAADRMVDAARGGTLQERHWFHLHYRRAFLTGILCAAFLLVACVVRLPRDIRTVWLQFSIPLAVYLILVHGARLPRLPKEAIVGIFFAAATTAPVLASGSVPWLHLLPSALLFAVVCWMNGIAIARWERRPSACPQSVSGFLMLARWHTFVALSTVLAGISFFASTQTKPVALAGLLSMLLLLLLDRRRERFHPVVLRALADAALLTPVVVWPLLYRLLPR